MSYTLSPSQPPTKVRYARRSGAEPGSFSFTIPGVVYLTNTDGTTACHPLTKESWRNTLNAAIGAINDIDDQTWDQAKKNRADRSTLKQVLAGAVTASLQSDHSTMPIPCHSLGWELDQVPNTGHTYNMVVENDAASRTYTITVDNAHSDDWSIDIYGATYNPAADRVDVDASRCLHSASLNVAMPFGDLYAQGRMEDYMKRFGDAHLRSLPPQEVYSTHLTSLGHKLKPLLEYAAQFKAEYPPELHWYPESKMQGDDSSGKTLEVAFTLHDFEDFAIDKQSKTRISNMRWEGDEFGASLRGIYGKGKKKDELKALEWRTSGKMVDSDNGVYRLTPGAKQSLLDRVVWCFNETGTGIRTNPSQLEAQLVRLCSIFESVKSRWLPVGPKPGDIEPSSAKQAKTITSSSKLIDVYPKGSGMNLPELRMVLH